MTFVGRVAGPEHMYQVHFFTIARAISVNLDLKKESNVIFASY